MDEFLTKVKFSRLVESTVATKKMSYMQACLHVCDIHNIEPNEVKKFISPSLKEKIEQEAISLNFLKSTSATLPM